MRTDHISTNPFPDEDSADLAEAIVALRGLSTHYDIEQAGSDAIGILLRFMEARGFDDIVETYEEVIDRLALRIKHEGFPPQDS